MRRTEDGPFKFSGVPVICRRCASQLTKMTYKKGKDGSYLCPECFEKLEGKQEKAV